MPCWFYEKKDLRVTPSLKDGIKPEIEARYRREGARFIIDTGTKMGLRYDTCATGAVYFHRFYMFHSFREFHRYVTAATCLFLAGKVEETPKKCKDLMKITRSMLTDKQVAAFGDDPKEEIMTMEKILLQTIKFDLMVEHPYAYLLKLGKKIKGDKEKTQKLVQMAWTFVNDSLCTMLCLQWEPDIIAVALMYLASRLTKVDVNDWHGKVSGQKVKWYEGLVQDATLDILEDVCHQVLDLYSTTPQASKEDSPPPPPPPPRPKHPAASVSPAPMKTPTKRSRSPSPIKSSSKSSRQSTPVKMKSATPTVDEKSQNASSKSKAMKKTTSYTTLSSAVPISAYNRNNSYISSKGFSSSFMSGEGSSAIQTLIGGQPVPAAQMAAVTPNLPSLYVANVSVANTSLPPPSHNQYASAVPGNTKQAPPPPPARSAPNFPSSAYQPTQPVSGNYSQQYQGAMSVDAPPQPTDAMPSANNYNQNQYTQQPPPQLQQKQQQHVNYNNYSSYPPPPPQQQQAMQPQHQQVGGYPYPSQPQAQVNMPQPLQRNQQANSQQQQQYGSGYPSQGGGSSMSGSLFSNQGQQQSRQTSMPVQHQQQQQQNYGGGGYRGQGRNNNYGGHHPRGQGGGRHPNYQQYHSGYNYHQNRSNSNRLPPRR